MKAKWTGLLLLLVVALGAAGYVWLTNAQQVSEIQGYVGGEKIGLLEDAEVQEILRERYKLSMDYTRAGSIEMVTMDAEGQNYLFPSNQTALELYAKSHGAPEAQRNYLEHPHCAVHPQRRCRGPKAPGDCPGERRRHHSGYGGAHAAYRVRRGVG